ncbi:MAG: ABC transporter ATP-binding protein [Anaerolineae bacterium]
MNPPTISLSDIVFSYEGQQRTLFEGLSLDIPPGTITAILGPNGAGKTTLLHLILGILAPEKGVVVLARRPRHQYSRRDLGQLIGLVSQNEYIPFNFSVLEYVLLGRAPHLQLLQTPRETDVVIVNQVLREVGLDHLKYRSIQSLSGGERQLVMVARALAQRPRILLLDEPTSHLDLSNKGRVLAIVKQQAAQGVTVAFTTHEPNLASDVAEFVVLMRGGQMLEAGPTREVLNAASLTRTYGVPVQVLDIDGRHVVVSEPVQEAVSQGFG